MRAYNSNFNEQDILLALHALPRSVDLVDNALNIENYKNGSHFSASDISLSSDEVVFPGVSLISTDLPNELYDQDIPPLLRAKQSTIPYSEDFISSSKDTRFLATPTGGSYQHTDGFEESKSSSPPTGSVDIQSFFSMTEQLQGHKSFPTPDISTTVAYPYVDSDFYALADDLRIFPGLDFFNNILDFLPNVDSKEYKAKTLSSRFIKVFLHAFSYLARTHDLSSNENLPLNQRRYDLYGTVAKEAQGEKFTRATTGEVINHYSKIWDQVFRGFYDILQILESYDLDYRPNKFAKKSNFLNLANPDVQSSVESVQGYCRLIREFEKQLWDRLSESDRENLLNNTEVNLGEHLKKMQISPPRSTNSPRQKLRKLQRDNEYLTRTTLRKEYLSLKKNVKSPGPGVFPEIKFVQPQQKK